MAKSSKKETANKRQLDAIASVPPVYFLSIDVENVLCFKDKQTLDLTDEQGNPAQWTVILGDNGVGKTTLLRCLAQMEVKRIINSESTLPDRVSYVPAPSLSIWANDVLIPSSKDLKIYATVTSRDSLSNKQVKLLANNDSQTTRNPKIRFELGYSYKYTDWDTFQELVCYGYGAIRNLGSTALQDSFPLSNSLSLFTENVSRINAEEWLLQTDYAARTASGGMRTRLEKQLAQIIEILKHILPDVDDIQIKPASEGNPRPRAEFKTPYGWVHIKNLGLGYRTAIAWMVDLAVRLFRRYPNSPDPLAEPAIVLVDEIDLHLHPRWQRTIMDFLTERFPNTQFIVTAHSPLVVQAAQNANIVLLRREGDRVVIDNNPEIIKNWRVDQVLTSMFDVPSRPTDIEESLKRRREILSKGHLTAEDEVELEKLAAKIGSLPTAETPEDIEAMDIIRQAAQLLKNA
jgi:predicted ATP-binding protein involved in virulence